MTVRYKTSFLRDLKKVEDSRILQQLKQLISRVEEASNLQDIPDLKKLAGGKSYYRIKVGHYRIGLVVEGEIVDFVRCLDRKEIYRYFP